MSSSATAVLRELQRLKYQFEIESSRRKVELFDQLAQRSLPTADRVLELHEVACFSRAFPDDAKVLSAAESILDGFGERRDLLRFRSTLVDTGVAGARLYFRFYWLTAIWLHRQGWSEHLTIEWDEFGEQEKLSDLWHLLLPFSETAGLDAIAFSTREWVRRMKSPRETDAGFLIRRFATLAAPIQLVEKLYEDLDVPLILDPGPTTPARGRDHWAGAPVVFRSQPPERGRPDLRSAIAATRIEARQVSRREGQRLIDLANSCMVSRHRDLLIFLYANPADVQMIDCGDGLRFACMGAIPDRRLMLESVYGFLTIMNGVPIGYVLCSALFESSEIAYNVFETFRGRGAAHIYAKVLGMVHQLFGATSFAVDPYQLGHENEEGQQSGAWWFYYKLGFRPQDPVVKRLVREELRRMKRQPGARTSPARLNELAEAYMFFQLAGERREVLGNVSLGNIGLWITRYLADRFGGDREAGLDQCEEEAAQLCGLSSIEDLPRAERLAWRRWAPLALALPGVRRWTANQRRALGEVMRAKGGPAESAFVKRFDRHPRLRRALLELAAEEPA